MSIKILSHVWQTATVGGSKLLVLLALADFADDKGGNIYPSMATLAVKARLSVDQTRRVVHELIEDGVIELVSQGGWMGARNRSNEYRIVLGGTGKLQVPSTDASTGTSTDASTVPAPMQDDPSCNRHVDPPLKAAATPTVGEAWADNMPGTMTPMLLDQLKQLEKEYSAREIIGAIEIAVKRNKRTLGYVEGVLRRGVDLPQSNGAKPKAPAYIIDSVTGERKQVLA